MEDSGFSGALRLVGVDDFRGQSCINPIVLDKIERSSKQDNKRAKIELEDDGTYVEIANDGRKEVLETAKVDLKDCLACRYVCNVQCIVIVTKIRRVF